MMGLGGGMHMNAHTYALNYFNWGLKWTSKLELFCLTIFNCCITLGDVFLLVLLPLHIKLMMIKPGRMQTKRRNHQAKYSGDATSAEYVFKLFRKWNRMSVSTQFLLSNLTSFLIFLWNIIVSGREFGAH